MSSNFMTLCSPFRDINIFTSLFIFFSSTALLKTYSASRSWPRIWNSSSYWLLRTPMNTFQSLIFWRRHKCLCFPRSTRLLAGMNSKRALLFWLPTLAFFSSLNSNLSLIFAYSFAAKTSNYNLIFNWENKKESINFIAFNDRLSFVEKMIIAI